MKLAINLKFGSLADLFKKQLSFVLLGFIILIAIMSLFEMYGEIKKITEANKSSISQAQIVRVNLEGHQQLEKKLNDNSTFEPVPVAGADAFGTAPNKSE